MEENQKELIFKIAIVLGVCVIGAVYLLNVNHGEGDPYFVFYEVPFNDTFNNSVIHLVDKDIMNVRGLDVKQNEGKNFPYLLQVFRHHSRDWFSGFLFEIR